VARCRQRTRERLWRCGGCTPYSPTRRRDSGDRMQGAPGRRPLAARRGPSQARFDCRLRRGLQRHWRQRRRRPHGDYAGASLAAGRQTPTPDSGLAARETGMEALARACPRERLSRARQRACGRATGGKGSRGREREREADPPPPPPPPSPLAWRSKILSPPPPRQSPSAFSPTESRPRRGAERHRPGRRRRRSRRGSGHGCRGRPRCPRRSHPPPRRWRQRSP